MLRESLPEIVTETVPGPKASKVIERRKKLFLMRLDVLIQLSLKKVKVP